MEVDDAFSAVVIVEAARALERGDGQGDVRRMAMEAGHDPDLLLVLAEHLMDRPSIPDRGA